MLRQSRKTKRNESKQTTSSKQGQKRVVSKSPITTKKRNITTQTSLKSSPKSKSAHTSQSLQSTFNHMQSTSSTILSSKSIPIVTTSKRTVMTSDPLGLQQPDDVNREARETWISNRSAQEKPRVLLAGYRSFFGQHLFSHLISSGFNVFPVSKEPTSRSANVVVADYNEMLKFGLPDVDFVINCTGLNPWARDYDYNDLYESRVNSTKELAELIRKTPSKPYAYITLSSADIYPGNKYNKKWNETYFPPNLSPYLATPIERDEFDNEHDITSIQRLWRDVELASRIYIPETDNRTEQQIKEYLEMKQQYDRNHLKSSLFGSDEQYTTEKSQQNSKRKDLLTNAQVRSVQLRLGHLLCKEMQEFRDFRRELDNGKFGPIVGHGEERIPWIWIDDACRAVIHSMMHSLDGPVNVVSKHHASSNSFMNFITEINGTWSTTMEPRQLYQLYHGSRGDSFYTHRDVVPSKLLQSGFEYQCPSMTNAIELERSQLETQIFRAGGVDKLFRFGFRSLR